MNGGTPYLVPWPAMPLSLHTQLSGQIGQMGGQLAGQLATTAQLPAAAGQLGKLTQLQLQQLQQAQAQMSLSHFPQFMALTQPPGTAVAPQPQVTMAGGCGGVPGMYPLSALSLPPSMLTHNNLVTSIPKLILPGVKVNIINTTLLSYYLKLYTRQFQQSLIK